MQTIGLTDKPQVMIISAYAAAMKTLDSVLSDPNWAPVGVFYLPATVDAQLEAIGLVSGAGRTLRTRLYDLEEDEAVSNMSVDITDTVETRALSNYVRLTGLRLYRIEAEVIGSASGTGTLFTASLVSS